MSRLAIPPAWSHLGRRSWYVCLGIITIVAGVAVLIWPGATLRVAAVLFAVQLILAGVFRFVVSFLDTEETPGHRVQTAVLSGLAAVVGVFLLGDVDVGMVVLTIVLGIFWGVHGIIELIEAITHKDATERAWVVASGTMGLVVGVALLLSVGGPPAHVPSPVASLVLLVRVLGVWLVVFGVVLIVRAVSASFGRPAIEEEPSV